MKTYIFLSSFVFLAAQSLLFEGVAAVVGNAVILKSDVSQLVSITALQQKIDLNTFNRDDSAISSFISPNKKTFLSDK